MAEKRVTLKFSEAWILFILGLFLLSAWLRQSELLLIALFVSIITLLAWLWNALVLYRVAYDRELAVGRAFVGEQVSVTVTVTNHKALPVPWLSVDDGFPDSLTLQDRDLMPSGVPGRSWLRHIVSLGPNERVRWTYDIDCLQRGFYFFGPLQIRAGDILGFFTQEQQLKVPDRLIIYPRVRSLPELGFPGKEPFGEKKAVRHVIQDPIRTVGVREYHPEDTIRHIHWKSSARHAELQVKVYEPTITQQLVVFVNVASFAQRWMGVIPQRQEQVISVAASIAFHATERHFAIGLIANGTVPHSDQPIKVLPGRAPEQLMRVLEALAAVTSMATVSIEQLLARQSYRLSLGATLVVVTSVVTQDLLAQMIRLRDAGRRLSLVSMDPEFQEEGPSGIRTYHIPLAEADFTGMWTRAAEEEEPVVPAPSPWARDGRGIQ